LPLIASDGVCCMQALTTTPPSPLISPLEQVRWLLPAVLVKPLPRRPERAKHCARKAPRRHTKRRARRRALPRARYQARLSSPTCCQGRRAPAAPVRCCARSSCGRRCWLEKQSTKTSCLLEITCSTKTPRGAGLRARLPEIFPAGKMISRCPSVAKPRLSARPARRAARAGFQTQLGFPMCFRGRRAASCPNPLLGAIVLWKTLLAGKTEYLNFFSS
jgi:hypothetical protein